MGEWLDHDVEGADPVSAAHDHAWRRVSSDANSPGRLGIYRCDLCSTAWSM
jgi:hypothetical protein